MTRVCFKLINVLRESRARDIKQSLRDRECNPSKIVMKGDVCYVHYYKPEKEVESSANRILEALTNLSIKSGSGEVPEYQVKVELMKLQQGEEAVRGGRVGRRNNNHEGGGGEEAGEKGAEEGAETKSNIERIETTDVTAV